MLICIDLHYSALCSLVRVFRLQSTVLSQILGVHSEFVTSSHHHRFIQCSIPTITFSRSCLRSKLFEITLKYFLGIFYLERGHGKNCIITLLEQIESLNLSKALFVNIQREYYMYNSRSDYTLIIWFFVNIQRELYMHNTRSDSTLIIWPSKYL